jgi:hypothetical protein
VHDGARTHIAATTTHQKQTLANNSSLFSTDPRTFLWPVVCALGRTVHTRDVPTDVCCLCPQGISPPQGVHSLSSIPAGNSLLSRTFTCHDNSAYSLAVSTSALALLSLSVACHHTGSARGMNAPCLNGTRLKRSLRIVLFAPWHSWRLALSAYFVHLFLARKTVRTGGYVATKTLFNACVLAGSC